MVIWICFVCSNDHWNLTLCSRKVYVISWTSKDYMQRSGYWAPSQLKWYKFTSVDTYVTILLQPNAFIKNDFMIAVIAIRLASQKTLAVSLYEGNILFYL